MGRAVNLHQSGGKEVAQRASFPKPDALASWSNVHRVGVMTLKPPGQSLGQPCRPRGPLQCCAGMQCGNSIQAYRTCACIAVICQSFFASRAGQSVHEYGHAPFSTLATECFQEAAFGLLSYDGSQPNYHTHRSAKTAGRPDPFGANRLLRHPSSGRQRSLRMSNTIAASHSPRVRSLGEGVRASSAWGACEPCLFCRVLSKSHAQRTPSSTSPFAPAQDGQVMCRSSPTPERRL